MFEIRITSLHEFRIFVKIIKGQDLEADEIKDLSEVLKESASKLIKAEEEANKL